MMITDKEYKCQEEEKEEKEEKIDWEEEVKRKFPYDWLERLAAIQTAESIIGAEALNRGINWEKIYQACQVCRGDIFSLLYNREEVANINQCYLQFIQGEKPALEKIYYFANYDISLNQISAWLQNANCRITSLNLWNNGIFAAGAALLAEALKSEYCKLTSLDFEGNKIGAEGAKALALALKSEHCKLISLNLGDNQISTVGAKAIADALQSEHCRLTSLNLGDNQISTVGAKAIADALQSEHCRLTSLNLGDNQISTVGAKAIADALQSEHCKLISLDLRQNQIGDASAQEIANAMKSGHFRLTSLNLQFNRIGEVGKLAITLALKHPYCPCDLHIKLDSDVEKYILKFNEEWHQAQELYTLLSHPRGDLQSLSVLPPYVTIKVLFPYLFDIFKDELKPVTEEKQVEIPTYAHDDQGKIKTKNGKPIVIKTFWVLRKVSTGELEEPQSQVGDCFLDNHYEHFKIIQAQRQDVLKSYEAKSSGQIDEKSLPQSCNSPLKRNK